MESNVHLMVDLLMAWLRFFIILSVLAIVILTPILAILFYRFIQLARN